MGCCHNYVDIVVIILCTLLSVCNYYADGQRLKTLMFFGDQLTVERARASKKARVAADTVEEALDGLEPAASDWHAEFNFLQVLVSITSELYS